MTVLGSPLRPVLRSPLYSPLVGKWGGAFSPSDLFQSGDILLWYDPSDLTTMYKDTAGTQPVTADGDSVALMLDKGQWGGKTLEQVLAAQPELVTNGGFATNDDTGWTRTVDNGWNFSAGAAAHTGATGGRIRQAITTTVGKMYVLKFDLDTTGDLSLANTSVSVRNTADTISIAALLSADLTANAARSYSLYFTATQTTHYVAYYSEDSAALDNVSVKEIPGYHRVQATGTSMPKYKTDPNPAAAENSPERVTNGGFDSDTAWAKGAIGVGAAATISSGVANLPRTDSSNLSHISQTLTGPAALYKVEITVGSAGVTFRAGATVLGSGYANEILAVGTHTLFFTATAANPVITVYGSTNGTTPTADNVSVKEIPASAPYIHWLLYDGTDDGHATGTIPFNTVTSDGAARRNLFVDTDKLNHTTWTNGVSSNGTRTNGSLSVSDAEGYVYVIQQVTLTAAAHTVSFEAVCDQTVAAVPLRATFGAATATTLVDFVAGVPQRVSMSLTAAASTNNFNIGLDARNAVVPGGSNSTGYILTLNKAQLELGSTATDFQNIGTDEVAACAGVTKSSDAAAGAFAEFSASSSSNNGSFALLAPSAAAYNLFWRSKGTGAADNTPTGFVAPFTGVLTGTGKIASDTSTLRANGAVSATSATDQGTGNFGSYPLYFGRRGGTTLPFNGGEYQTVIRSRLLSAAELASLETFVAEKTGVIL